MIRDLSTVHKWLYGVTFPSFCLFILSQILSYFLGVLFLLLLVRKLRVYLSSSSVHWAGSVRKEKLKREWCFSYLSWALTRPLSYSSNQNKDCVLPFQVSAVLHPGWGKMCFDDFGRESCVCSQSIIFIWVLECLILSTVYNCTQWERQGGFTFSFLLHPFCLSNICWHLTHPSTGVSFWFSLSSWTCVFVLFTEALYSSVRFLRIRKRGGGQSSVFVLWILTKLCSMQTLTIFFLAFLC